MAQEVLGPLLYRSFDTESRPGGCSCCEISLKLFVCILTVSLEVNHAMDLRSCHPTLLSPQVGAKVEKPSVARAQCRALSRDAPICITHCTLSAAHTFGRGPHYRMMGQLLRQVFQMRRRFNQRPHGDVRMKVPTQSDHPLQDAVRHGRALTHSIQPYLWLRQCLPLASVSRTPNAYGCGWR